MNPDPGNSLLGPPEPRCCSGPLCTFPPLQDFMLEAAVHRFHQQVSVLRHRLQQSPQKRLKNTECLLVTEAASSGSGFVCVHRAATHLCENLPAELRLFPHRCSVTGAFLGSHVTYKSNQRVSCKAAQCRPAQTTAAVSHRALMASSWILGPVLVLVLVPAQVHAGKAFSCVYCQKICSFSLESEMFLVSASA